MAKLEQEQLNANFNHYGTKKLEALASHPKLEKLGFKKPLNALKTTKGYWGQYDFRQCLEKMEPKSFSYAENKEFVDFFLGAQFAPVFDYFEAEHKNYVYQTGYYRRSYRNKSDRDIYRSIFNQLILNLMMLLFQSQNMDVVIENERSVIDIEVLMASDPIFIASRIDAGDERVTSYIEEAILSDNNTKVVSRPMIQAIAHSKSTHLMELLGKLLLAAQRQEGLRQAILESIDNGRIEILIYFMGLIVDNDLMRFSSVTRAVLVWTNLLALEGANASLTKRIAGLALSYLKEESAREAGLKSENKIEIYLALWAYACYDSNESIAKMNEILDKKIAYRNVTAMAFLGTLSDPKLNEKVILRVLKEDDDLETIAWAIRLLTIQRIGYYWGDPYGKLDYHFEKKKFEAYTNTLYEVLFEKLKVLEKEVKKEKTFVDSGFDGNVISVSRNDILNGMLVSAFVLEDDEKIDYVGGLESLPDYIHRAYIEHHLYKIRNDEERMRLVMAVGNRSEDVVSQAAKYLELMNLTYFEEEIIEFEKMLRLKKASSREAVLGILAAQGKEGVLASVGRLTQNGKLDIRLGGLDLVLNTIKTKDEFQTIREDAKTLVSAMKIKSPSEQSLVDQIMEQERASDSYTQANLFGMRAEGQEDAWRKDSKVTPLKKFDVKKELFSISVKDFQKYIGTINAFIVEHAEVIDSWTNDYGDTYEYAFGAMNGNLVGRDKKDGGRVFGEILDKFHAKHKLPFAFYEEIEYLVEARPDVVRYDSIGDSMQKLFNKEFPADDIMKKREILGYAPGNTYFNNKANFIKAIVADGFDENKEAGKNFTKYFDALRYFSESVSYELYTMEMRNNDNTNQGAYLIFASNSSGRNMGENPVFASKAFRFLINKAKSFAFARDENDKPNEERMRDYLGLVQLFQDKICPGQEIAITRNFTFMDLELVSTMYETGLICDNSFLEYLTYSSNSFSSITNKHRYRNIKPYFELFPKAFALANVLMERLVSIEIPRGDSKTIATDYINGINAYYGTEYLVDILGRLDEKDTFVRGYSGNDGSKKNSLSKLITAVRPREGEDVETFKTLMKGKKVSEKILLNVAMYSIHWTEIIAQFIGWKGLSSISWYFRAHTGEVNDTWKPEVAKYTPIKMRDFQNGAFDVDWFLTSYKEVGKARFEIVYDSAKYISTGGNHRRAQIFADAALGKLKKKDVMERIKDKRNQDFVKAYGILPLAKNKNADVLKRYEEYQKFLKESKQFGAQRRASEALAVNIGLENLSRTAKFRDVTSLTLVMESMISNKNVGLFEVQEIGGYDLQIINPALGSYKLQAVKDGKILKSVPAKIKKDKSYLELADGLKNTREQYRRSVKSFEKSLETEGAMVAENLITIMESPVFRPLLENIVFKTADDKFGYLKGSALVSPSGAETALDAETSVFIAHPYHLFASKVWEEYQKDIFDRQVSQPFKQVFRELYTPNKDELEAGFSNRYAGHQLQSGKLFSLMKAAGWAEGAQRVFYDQNIVASLYGLSDYFSPGDIEEPTLESIYFCDRYTNERVSVKDVPPVVFSEIMRDVDLFVSVAYVGGVDPEASHSTIEMRGAIIREMLPLLKLKNVIIKDKFANIEGTYGTYLVHLGSGMIQKLMQGSVSILPIQSANRGKLFLPFMDEDPKTAEIVSKILLLAKDTEIKDPSIVEQIKA